MVPRWGSAILDQGLVALTNFLVSVLVTRAGGVGALGMLAILTVTVFTCTGLLRTLVLDPWLADRSSTTTSRMPGEAVTLMALGAGLAGALTGLVMFAAAPAERIWLLGGSIAAAAVLQDGGRCAAYKAQLPHRALLSDVLVALVLMGVVGIGQNREVWSPGMVLQAWLLGLMVGFLSTGTLLARERSPRCSGRWWRSSCKRLAVPLLGDSAAFFLCVNVTTYLLAYYGSSTQVGAVRVVTSLYSPVAILFTGLSMWLLPTLAALDMGESHRVQRKATLALSAVAVIAGAVIVTCGGPLAKLVFGESAEPSHVGLLLGALAAWSNAIGTVFIAAVKVFGSYSPISRTRLLVGVASVAAMPVWGSSWTSEGYLTLALLQSLAVLGIAARQSHHRGRPIARHARGVARLTGSASSTTRHCYAAQPITLRAAHLLRSRGEGMSDSTVTEDRVNILGIHVSVTTLDQAVDRVRQWIKHNECRYVCVTDVHALLVAAAQPELTNFYNASGMTLPDGMPLVWASRAAGARNAVRVSGPDFFPAVIEASVGMGWRHFLVGGDQGVGERLAAIMRRRYPGAEVVGSYCPPFRVLSEAEKEELIQTINRARPHVVWFALGAPKQEQWMAEYHQRLSANVLVGVGAAFALQVGDVTRAPAWMRSRGLEWLYRLIQEPSRLWRRYLLAVPTFGVQILLHPPRRVGDARVQRRRSRRRAS